MSLFDWIAGKKQHRANPHEMAIALLLGTEQHHAALLKVSNEWNIRLIKEQSDDVYKELYIFYYYLFMARVRDYFEEDLKTINHFSSTFLIEASGLPSRKTISKPLGEWFKNVPVFNPEFATKYQFYVQDKVDEKDKSTIDHISRICSNATPDLVMLPYIKLQFQIASIMNVTYKDRSFIPIWIHISTRITLTRETLMKYQLTEG